MTGRLRPCLYPPLWCCASCPRLALLPPSGIFTAPTLLATGGMVVYSLHQQPSSLTPCPNLAAYCRAGRITAPIVDVDRLPDHIHSAGLDLLDSSPHSSAGDTLGMSFMAEYLPVPPPPAVSRIDPVSLSPPFHGGSGGSIHSFRPATQPFIHVPLRSVRSMGERSQLDREPQDHISSRSGRVKPSSEHGGRLSAVSLRCPSPPLWGMGGDMMVAVSRSHHILARLRILAGILRIPVFSVPEALLSQES